MLSHPKFEGRLESLGEQLRLSQAATPDLISRVIQEACMRLQTLRSAGKASRLDRLIEAGAWTDATLALLELELPQWKLRRLAYEDGEWFCCLSKQSWLPLDLDELVEATVTESVGGHRNFSMTRDRT